VRDTIDQFMWGYQQSFRRGFERSIERIFEALGQPCSVSAYLIGILQPGGDRHPLCIEPEDGPLVPSHFEGLDKRAAEIYADDPESSMHHSHPLVHERRHRWARERALGAAIKEVIDREAAGEVACFVGPPANVEQHLVFPVIGIPLAVMEVVPRLSREWGDDPRWRVPPSIARAAIDETLRMAERALYMPDAGEGAEIGAEPDAILRRAARRFLESVVVLSGNEFRGSLAEAMDRVSTTKYEKRVGSGRLLLAQRDAVGLEWDLEFREQIQLRETRTLRKLLELSGRQGAALLTDGDEVYGLGRLNDRYEPTSESVFELVVLGDGTWELRHHESALVTVEYGSPKLPRHRLEKSRFSDVVRRVLGATSDVDALWTVVETASGAEHGTMIVISADAELEADRLSAQGLPVVATRLQPEVLQNVVRIDGAVLVDPRGVCHGLGVILDGTAEGAGDRARGARYNSAVKYLAGASSPAVIVIVSEDGMINLLPDLRPRVRRSEIARAMDDLRTAGAIEPVHPERFYKAFDRVKALRFYLSADQCDEANRLRTDHWDRRRAAGAQIWINEGPLTPDLAMDDSYLLD
jgi:hypothetical protein